MPSAITSSVRILNSEALASDIVQKPTYVYIARDESWPDEDLPPSVINSDQEKLDIASNLLGIKKINDNNISSVIPRIDWSSGTVYDFYDYRVNMVEGRKPSGQRYNFYVMTDEFNVYKCISNNGGVPSTFKPNSQQLTTYQTPDGYVWKYMYTIRASDVFSFLTPEWMPVYTLTSNDGSVLWNVQQTAIKGGIHEIITDNPGIGYSALTPPTVEIVGNGSGATAIAVVDSVTTRISRIVVTNPGTGYTTATTNLINSGSGVGAVITPILSPVAGHGADPKAELGGFHKMIKVNLTGTESGNLPISTFRQAGLIHKPLSNDLGSVLSANNVNGIEIGSTLVGQTTGASGTVALVEIEFNRVWLSDVIGNYTQNEVFSVLGTNRVILSVENDTNILFNLESGGAEDILPMSGDILYISNRTYIQRREDQTEEVRMVISF